MKSKIVSLIITAIVLVNSSVSAFANITSGTSNTENDSVLSISKDVSTCTASEFTEENITTPANISAENYSDDEEVTYETFIFDAEAFRKKTFSQSFSLFSAKSSFSESNSKFRDILDSSQKEVYDFLLIKFNNANTNSYTLNFKNKPNKKNAEHDIEIAEQAFYLDNPKMYWADRFTNTCKNVSSYTESVTITLNSAYNYNYSNENAKTVTLMSKVNNIINSMNAQNFTNDIDKFTYLHDTLMDNASYDKSYNKNNPSGHKENNLDSHSPYGALVLKYGVCEGYSRALQLLCHEAGIPCLSIIGFKGKGQHQWNLVKIDKKWAFVDPTDNYLTGYSYKYNFFLRDTPNNYDDSFMPLAVPKTSIPENKGFIIKYGDVDRDGVLTMNDVSMAFQKMFGDSPYKGADKVIIDVNGNGICNSSDTDLIQSAVLNGSDFELYDNLKDGKYN